MTSAATPRAAAVYVRISKDKTGAGLGVQRQGDDCRALAARLGWRVAPGEYVDNDLSAYSGKPRPGYLRLLDDLRAGRVDGVLVWHTDRLHRSPAELETFISVIEDRAVSVQTVTAGTLDLSTATGRMQARIAGAVARQEVEHAVERMRAEKAQKRASGLPTGGRRPFGYLAGGMELDPTEAALLRQAAADVLAGTSLAAVAGRWTEAGVLTSTGVRWTATGLRRTLASPRYAGRMAHRGEDVGPAAWPALLTEDTHRALLALFAAPGRRTSPGRLPAWLGSGLYLCGACEGTLRVGWSRRRTDFAHHAYTCRNGFHVARAQEPLDALVSATVVARLRRPDLADLVAPGVDEGAVRDARRELTALRGRLDGLGPLYADGAIDARTFAATTADLRARIATAEQQLDGLTGRGPLAAFVTAVDPGQAWIDAPLDVRRAVLAELVAVVVLPARRGRPPGWTPGSTYFDPSRVEFRWRA